MIEIRCDICGRQCDNGYYVISVEDHDGHRVGANLAVGQDKMHICMPRDGDDIDCSGFYKQGLAHAQEQTHKRVLKHR